MSSIPLELAQQLIRLRSIALRLALETIQFTYRQALERLLLPT